MIEELVPATVATVATRADLSTESVFKAWLALTGEALAFEDADVRLDRDSGTFTARLRADELRGRRRASGAIVATAVVIAR